MSRCKRPSGRVSKLSQCCRNSLQQAARTVTSSSRTENISLNADRLQLLLAVCAGLFWLFILFLLQHVSVTPDVFGRYSVGYALAILLAATLAASLTAAAASDRAIAWVGRHRRELTLVLTTALLLMTAIEFTVRSLNLMGVAYYQQLADYDNVKVADSDLVYRHAPNQRTDYGSFTIETNELGMRDWPVGPKSSDEFRILALGDSVILGWGVELEQTSVKVLERLLWQSLGRNVRVLNAGVGSYNTEQEESYLRAHAKSLQADAVLLMYVSNDIIVHRPFRRSADVSSSQLSLPDRIAQWLWHSWAYRLLVHIVRYGRAARISLLQVDAAGKARSLAALARIIDYCRYAALPVAVVMYEHVPNAASTTMSREVRALTDRAGVPYASTHVWLLDANPADLVISRIDSHLNADGNERVAQGLHDFLMRNRHLGLLPAEATP